MMQLPPRSICIQLCSFHLPLPENGGQRTLGRGEKTPTTHGVPRGRTAGERHFSFGQRKSDMGLLTWFSIVGKPEEKLVWKRWLMNL